MSNYFEKVSRFADNDIVKIPVRETANAAGYDICVAEDCIVPSYQKLMQKFGSSYSGTKMAIGLDDMKGLTKGLQVQPTLVSTGLKCHLDSNKYLELVVRSSTPLKYWLILANGQGVIDADYYGNPANEGEIFFQLINLSPFDILLKAGDKIGQGIIKSYYKTDNDIEQGERKGGFGSTNG